MRTGAAGRSVGCAVVALLALAACTGGGHDPAAQRPGGGAPSTGSEQSTSAAAPVDLLISPTPQSRDIRPSRVIHVRAHGGTLRSVDVRSGSDEVIGRFSADHASWRSTSTLHVSSRYAVTATGTNATGQTATATSWFRTLAPASTFSAAIAAQRQETYGVGMPIQISFSRPVTNRSDVERALHVTTSKPVVGAWQWIDAQHVNFRPRDYWPAHTDVKVDAAMDGVRAAPGVYGTSDYTRRFEIGRSLIVVASTVTHRLHLYQDGKLIHNWPISTGQPGDDTPNGTYLTIEKANPVRMRPADIAPGQPGYYDLEVPWSVRFTWSGIYLHDAYWSVYEQGHVNVSHGCVNMPPAAAEKYYKMERHGDPVTVTGSPVAGTPGDGWTDWFYSWRQLLARSALHKAVEAGPDGSRFVAPSAVPASTGTAPLGRPEVGNSAAS
ncbi:MAG TPA: Ig-like domain-containing protein [Jatrophihabitans sp.]|nr:Ig-like domain-containing protein [Jatrophihabitans sp.]